jgi:hypothetical protein
MHEEFEKWYATTKNDKTAVWKPELNRYTVMSTKQFAWEIWNAARGIDYKYNHGYESTKNSTSAPVLESEDFWNDSVIENLTVHEKIKKFDPEKHGGEVMLGGLTGEEIII